MLFVCFILFSFSLLCSYFLKRERRCGVGWVGRIFEEVREGKPWSEYITWKKSIYNKKTKTRKPVGLAWRCHPTASYSTCPACVQFSLCTIQIALHSTGPGTLCYEMCDIFYLTFDRCPESIWCLSQWADPLSLSHVLLIAVLWGVDFFKVSASEMEKSREGCWEWNPWSPIAAFPLCFCRVSHPGVRYTDGKVPVVSLTPQHPLCPQLLFLPSVQDNQSSPKTSPLAWMQSRLIAFSLFAAPIS